MTLRTVARETDSVRTISLIERFCSKWARRISPILSTTIIPIGPSQPIKAKRKDADTHRQRGVGFGHENAPQGVNIASDFAVKSTIVMGVSSCAVIGSITINAATPF